MTQNLSNYDFIFGIIILVSTIFGVIRGGVAELLATSSWFIALFVMHEYSEHIKELIPTVVENNILRSLIGYVIAFIGVAIVITIIKLAFHKVIKNLGLGGLNYLIGALFGVARGLIICALLIIVVEFFHFDLQQKWRTSVINPVLLPTIAIIVDQIGDIKPVETMETISQIQKLQLKSNNNILGK